MLRTMRVVLAGLVAGFLVLGVGGRIAMRLTAFTAPEPPQLTVAGTAQVLLAGAAWGAVTAPLLLLMDGLRPRLRWGVGLIFGVLVLVLAGLAVGLVLGMSGRIVAPPAFIVLSAVLFPGLFVLHGVGTDWLLHWWMRLPREGTSSNAAT